VKLKFYTVHCSAPGATQLLSRFLRQVCVGAVGAAIERQWLLLPHLPPASRDCISGDGAREGTADRSDLQSQLVTCDGYLSDGNIRRALVRTVHVGKVLAI